jgi:alpha-glucosidase
MPRDISLQPHHDGSALYVLNQKPKLHDKVKVRLRVHSSLGKLAQVLVRQSENGEAFFQAPAKVVKTEGEWSWYQAEITMYNPQINYRWCFVTDQDDVLWLNALGLSELESPDI